MLITDELRALLQFLAELDGHDDPLELLADLMAEAAAQGRQAEPLEQLVIREALRLRDYWDQVLRTGKTALGNLGDLDGLEHERQKFQGWYNRVRELLEGVPVT